LTQSIIGSVPEARERQRGRSIGETDMFKHLMICRVSWCGALLALLLSFQPALTQEIVTGTEVVCNSGKQAERYVTLFDGDEEETVTQVNTEAEDEDACRVTSVAYLRGNDVAKAVTKEGTFVIARVLIVGFVTPRGFHSVPHFVQFTVFKIDERAA
jgi:hypothetical protein